LRRETSDQMSPEKISSVENREIHLSRFSFFLSLLKNARRLLNYGIAIIWLQACVYHTLPTPVTCTDNPVLLEVLSVEDTDCAAGEGSIEVLASGGAGAYRYKLDNSAYQAGSFFSGLAAGLYVITAIDGNDCTTSLEVVVKNKTGLNILFETTASGCQSASGALTVIAVDGIPPYLYKIGNSDFQTGNTFDNLSQAQYTVVVNDASGCEVSQKVKVASGISFSAGVSSIIQSKCAITACHNGTQFPDLRFFQNIRENASAIRTQTANRNMPLNGTLTQAEINAISCWVDDGAPEN
jgi:hypothetical protein